MDTSNSKYNGARPKVRIFQPTGQQIPYDQAVNELPTTESLLKYTDRLTGKIIDEATVIASTGQLEY